MKKVTITRPKPTSKEVKINEEYKAEVKAARQSYNRSVKASRNRRDFKLCKNVQERFELLKKWFKSKDPNEVRQADRTYYSTDRYERIELARLLLGKLTEVSVWVGEGSYLSLAPLKIVGDHYSVEMSFGVTNRLRLKHEEDLKNKPTRAEVEQIVKRYFPNVTKADMSGKLAD